MANLEAFSMTGIKLWFWPNDHNPPHFHAKRTGEWEIKVRFLESDEAMLEIAWAKKKKSISRTDRKTLIEQVKKHRFEIFREWEQKVKPQ